MPSIVLTADARNRLANNLQTAVQYYNQSCSRELIDGTQFGVDKSTIRAFHKFNRPLATFNLWARNRIPELIGGLNFSTEQDFDISYERLAISLDTAFNPNVLLPYQRHKLIDLFLKWASHLEEIPFATRHWIVNFGYCPLDSYSLGLMRDVAPGTVLNNEEPRMSVITSEAAYRYVQEIIREICEQIPCRPLHFDHIAWNAVH